MRSLDSNPASSWQLMLPIIKRSLALFFLVDFLWRCYAHLMISQLVFPPLFVTQYNLTFHIYQLLGLQTLLVGNPIVAVLFDVFLISSFILLFIRPRNQWVNYAAFILFFIYTVVFRINLTHQAHLLNGMLMMSFIFLFKKQSNFYFVFQGLRYYVIWVYSSAFLWKLLNGALFDWETGIAVLQNNIAEYLYLNPDTIMSGIYYWALQHPAIVNASSIFIYLLEGFFLVGFFTKRFDALLIFLIIFIHFSLNLGADVLFIEWYIFIIAFIPLAKWELWNRKLAV